MKKILNINDLYQAIQDRTEIYHESNGKKFKFDVVRVLNTKFIELITMIKDGKLFIDNEY
jgi:hypothetical protein